MVRLSDTRALVDGPGQGGSSHHVTTQKIDNGYLVRKSICTDTGEYKSQETFSRAAPKVMVRVQGSPSGGIVGNEDAKDAAMYLGKK